MLLHAVEIYPAKRHHGHSAVLRDRLVRRAISLIDTPSRKYSLRTLPSIAMVITLVSPPKKQAG